MAIESSIYSQIQAPKQTNRLAQFAQMQQIEAAQKQNRLADLMYGEKEREAAGSRAMDAAYRDATGADGTIDRKKLYAGIAQTSGSKLPGVQKGFAESDKAARDAEKSQLEHHLKRFEIAGQLSNGVTDQASYDRMIQKTAEVFGPEAAAKMPPEYNPVLMEENRARAMDVKTQLEQKWKQMAYDKPDANAVLSAKTSTDNNRASVGASYANAAATRSVAASNVEAAKIKGDRDTEMKIADDYRAQSKGFKEVSDAYKTINATLDKATTSAAATLAGATKFMKLLDPGSVVRESELGMALAATGVFDRATNYVNTLQHGKVLTPSQATDFKKITEQIYGAAQAGQKQIDENYKQQAKTYGLRPEMIVQDLGQNTPTGAGGLPAMSAIDAEIARRKKGK